MTRRLYEDEADLDWIPVLMSIEGIIYYLDIVFMIQLYFGIEHVYSSVIVKQCNRVSFYVTVY